MDGGRLVYRLTEGYVALLVAAAVGTIAWFYAPNVAASPTLAAVWFAIGGFGVLVGITAVLVHRGRERRDADRGAREI